MAATPSSTVQESALPIAPVAPEDVRAVRHFNRFITRRIGVLDSYLGSDLSLTDMRVLYELAHRSQPVASEIGRDLGLDGGYLSRILRRFESAGWLQRTPSPRDARQSVLALTPAGHAAFAPLQQRSRDEAAALLAPLPPARRQAVLQAMQRIEETFAPGQESVAAAITLREPQPGDMGWVVQQHGEIYWREYGWDSRFEALVAGIAAEFLQKFRPGAERGWIAEKDGQRIGAVFVARKSATTAQLRMLLLTPEARGLGLGGRLVDECIAFARAQGYRRMVLWTHSCLTAARTLYARRGFTLTGTEAYDAFGQSLVAETWALRL